YTFLRCAYFHLDRLRKNSVPYLLLLMSSLCYFCINVQKMTKQEKVKFVIDTLSEIYPETPIPLDHKDPYTLLIAVLLSAQSTDKKVNEITPLLFEVADNPKDMIKLSVEEIREIIRPVGLSPMKAKGIHGLSHILLEKYNGVVPADIEALKEFPAVGHKTASVVVAQAFNIPA